MTKARVLFACLLALQGVLALVQPRGPFGGDEIYYVDKARHLVEHHSFAPADEGALAAERGEAHGTSDWRPQGYPLFVALCSLGDLDPPALRLRVTIVQFALLAGALWWLFSSLCGFVESPRRQIAIALMIGVVPWPFEYLALVGPDSLNASLLLLATLLLWRQRFFAGALLASFTFVLRPEMIAIVPPLIGAAVLLTPSRRLRNATCAAMAFLAVAGLQMSYRVWFTKELKPSLFGGLHIQDRGAFEWVHTWVGTENQSYDFVYGLTNGALVTTLPDRAFADAGERQAIAAAVERVREHGFSPEIDATFARVAKKRRDEAPLRSVIVPRLWHAVHLWANVETNSQLLHALTSMPRPPRRALLGLLLLLKLALILAFPISVATITGVSSKAIRRIGSDDLARLVTLMALVVVCRTLLIGIVLNWMAHRYMVAAWPHLLGVVAARFVASRRMPK